LTVQFCLSISISQVIGCEDRLRNDLYCVEWGVKLYSINQSSWLYCADEDSCSPRSPCQNGGSCIDAVNAYVCRCPAGYSGVNCQLSQSPRDTRHISIAMFRGPGTAVGVMGTCRLIHPNCFRSRSRYLFYRNMTAMTSL